MTIKNILSCSWKLPLVAVAFYGGTMLGGMAAVGLGLPEPQLPAGADQMVLGQYMLLVSLILAGSLALLSRNLSGGFVSRWLTLSFLVWIAYGVNNVLEGAIFTSMATASLFTVVLYTVASLTAGAAAAWLFPPAAGEHESLQHLKTCFAARKASAWLWRFAGCINGFPTGLPGLWTPDRAAGDGLL